jgi:glycosyltransferase involved in cell wall biosynthesis
VKPPAIVVVVKGWPRLSETFIAQELRGLELAGLSLHIVAMRHPTDTKRHPVHDEMQAGVTYLPEYLHHEPLRVLRGVLSALPHRGFWRTLAGFLGDLRHDLTRNRMRRFGQACVMVRECPRGAQWIHAHFMHTPASVADYAARIMGRGYSISAHAKDIWTSTERDLAGKLARAAWVVTCTAGGHGHLARLAAEPSRVHLSYHGLNLDRFAPFTGTRPPRDGSGGAPPPPSPPHEGEGRHQAAAPAQVSGAESLPPPSWGRDGEGGPVRIVSVGRAVPKKGYDVLLRALALLPAGLDWRFTHMGDGGERKALQVLAEKLGIADRLAWTGAVDQAEVLAAYRASDLFALACRITPDGDRDGLPNVLVEAASQRLCCVTTNISGIPELLSDGENSLLVPPEDAPALARALERAIRDPGLRDRLGAAAEARVRATLDYHGSIRDLVALFRSVGVA